MAQYTGQPKGNVNKTVNEMTTNTPGHANSFNPYWRQIVDNDAELEKRINDHKNATADAHPASAISAAGGTNVQAEIDNLKSSVSSGKNDIASAITDMGQPANGSETFAQLAAHIRDISKDANAGTGDVLSGKTFYQGGAKRTGTMPNYSGGYTNPLDGLDVVGTAYNETVGRFDLNIPDGYHTQINAHILGAIPSNIKAGAKLGHPTDPTKQIVGTFTSDANAGAGDIVSGKTAYVNGNKIAGNIPNVGGGTNQVSTLNDGTGGPGGGIISIKDGGGDFSLFVNFVPPRGYYDGTNSKIALRFWGIKQSVIKAGQSIGWTNGTELKGTFTSDANAVARDILTGKSAYVNGNKVNGTMPNRVGSYNELSWFGNGAGDVDFAIPQGYYDGNTRAKIRDGNLNPNNIRSGVSIFGVTGNVQQFRQARGLATSDGQGCIEVTGLGFKPYYIIIHPPGIGNPFTQALRAYYIENWTSAQYSVMQTTEYVSRNGGYVNYGGFRLYVGSFGSNHEWGAVGWA